MRFGERVVGTPWQFYDKYGLLIKVVIGGNLAFGMGDGEITNQHPAQEIWWEILWEMLREFLRDRVEGKKPI